MPNFTDLFSDRPAPIKVKGGRIVKGRAMSGSVESREIVESELDREVTKKRATGASAPDVVKRRSGTIMNRTNEMYLEFMEGKGWLKATEIANGLGVPVVSVSKVLHRLNASGKIELKVERKSGGPGKPLRLWRKK